MKYRHQGPDLLDGAEEYADSVMPSQVVHAVVNSPAQPGNSRKRNRSMSGAGE